MSSTVPNEQPMSKRQRIDSLGIVADGTNGDGNDAGVHRAFAAIANGGSAGIDSSKETLNSSSAPPDILPTTTTFGPISANKLSSSTMPANILYDTDEMDNASPGTAVAVMLRRMDNAYHGTSKSNGRHDGEFPDLLKTTSGVAAIASTSNHILHPKSSTSTASTATPSCSSNSRISNETSHRTNHSTSASTNNLDEFQLHLMTQCLCDINDRVLRRPFESYTYKDDMGTKHSVPLNEWPTHKVIEFLSNIQFLFDVYLKQNAKGQICARIMQVCDALVCNEQNIIDDIFNLHEFNNKYVRFLAGRVMASCMVIAKDKKELYDSWLTTVVGNLVVDYNHGEFDALHKVTFSLEIILRILEWRDKEQHPLEDRAGMDSRSAVDNDEPLDVPVIVPPIENNYFAMHYNSDAAASPITPPMMSSSQLREASPPLTPPVSSPTISDAASETTTTTTATTTMASTTRRPNTTCQLQTLSDSESFDTRDLKCNIVNALKNRWSRLADNMAECITALRRGQRNFEYAENTILTFLTLWEHIISVKANLSVDSTLPFHEKLTTFERILIGGNLSVAIYKQILTLFNESMCYATTLALQSDSELPTETTRLANEIFNSVKSQRIFNSLPVQQNLPENEIGFIGYKGPTIEYPTRYRNNAFANGHHSDDEDDDDVDDDGDDHNAFLASNRYLLSGVNDMPHLLRQPNGQANGIAIDEHRSNDRILLQKLVLLILNAIAVTVKPVRGDDSSDSSMDGSNSNSSTDYEAYENTMQIERATRDVLKKLIDFMKNKLNHHPETHFSKMVAHLFSDQDDCLIEAMICIVDTTTAFLPRHPFANSFAGSNRNQFITLINMLNPVYSFLELLELISFKSEVLLDFLISEETCFLWYLIRFLKYIRSDWNTFRSRCDDWLSADNGRIGVRGGRDESLSVLARAMDTLTQLRVQIDRLVLQAVFPYPISPVLQLLRQCESLYEDPI